MISPGPVVITATFVGYLVAGFWGSLVSTVGIFLPSFILVPGSGAAAGQISRQSQRAGLWYRILGLGSRSCHRPSPSKELVGFPRFPTPLTHQSSLRLEWEFGSRIISLPGKEETIRGYSGVTLLIIDESSRVPDDRRALGH
jgi:hypothetical protein